MLYPFDMSLNQNWIRSKFREIKHCIIEELEIKFLRTLIKLILFDLLTYKLFTFADKNHNNVLGHILVITQHTYF